VAPDEHEATQPSAVNYTTELLSREYEQRRPVREALELLRQTYRIKERDVVELGSGLGFNLDVFAQENKVLGVEGLASAASAACMRGVRTITADLDGHLPLASESSDLVLCLDVLEHLVHPQECLREVRRILRPDGMLVVNVPNQFTLSGRLRVLLGSGIDSTRFFPEYPDWNNPHLRFFRRSSIGSLLEYAGFRVADDWCWRFPSLPFLHRSKALSRLALSRGLARRFPDVFAGGFFLLAVKA
jgi:SAM-dependent methyltransferase